MFWNIEYRTYRFKRSLFVEDERPLLKETHQGKMRLSLRARFSNSSISRRGIMATVQCLLLDNIFL